MPSKPPPIKKGSGFDYDGDTSPAARMMRGLALGALAFTIVGAGYAIAHDPVAIGATSDTASLRGTTEIMQVYEGGKPEGVVFIDGSALQPNKSYYAPQTVEVRGNIAEGVTLSTQGRLIVEGNVGPHARLTAWLPDAHGTLKYDGDMRAGIAVTGHVDAKASLTSNGLIAVSSAAKDVSYQTAYTGSVLVGNSAPETTKTEQAPRLVVPATHAPGM